MLKYFILISFLPSFAFAHAHKCQHTHYADGTIKWHCDGGGIDTLSIGKIFTATGKICAGPSIDEYGDMVTSYRGHAENLADQAASKTCYPYQFHRESGYDYKKVNADCRSTNPYVIKETVSAKYSCASF